MNRFHYDTGVGITYEWPDMPGGQPFRSKPSFTLGTVAGQSMKRPDGRRSVFIFEAAEDGSHRIRVGSRRPRWVKGAVVTGIFALYTLWNMRSANAGERVEIAKGLFAPNLTKLKAGLPNATEDAVAYATFADLSNLEPTGIAGFMNEKGVDTYIERHAPSVAKDWTPFDGGVSLDVTPEQKMREKLLRHGPSGMFVANVLAIPDRIEEDLAERWEGVRNFFSKIGDAINEF
jgi:hypothetical protein